MRESLCLSAGVHLSRNNATGVILAMRKLSQLISLFLFLFASRFLSSTCNGFARELV